MIKLLSQSIVLSVFFVIGMTSCSSDPFNEKNMYEKFLIYQEQGKSMAGLPKEDPKISKFEMERILEFKNFKIIKGYDINPTSHYIEFTVDRVYKINSDELEKIIPANDLKSVFGNRLDNFLNRLKENPYKKGDSRQYHWAMVLKKYDSGWEVENMGLPKD